MRVVRQSSLTLALSSFFFFLPIFVYSQIQVFFNHNSGSYYTDPYRNIERSGDNLEQVILDHIHSAKKSVYLAVHELRLPLIAKALVLKKRAGLDVRVILEHDYNFNILSQKDVFSSGEYEATKLEELRDLVDVNQNGIIELWELNSRDAIYILQKEHIPLLDDSSDNSRGSGLMHHKFIVVDEKSTLISTANFTLSCIHGDMNEPLSRGNANSMIRVDSKPLAKIFLMEFLQMWGNGKRGNFGHRKTYRGAQTAIAKGTKITVQFSPTSNRLNWEETVNGLIGEHLRRARKSVLAALFVFSEQKLSNIMQERSLKGVRIGALIEPKFAYRDYSELLDMLGLQMLKKDQCVYPIDNNPWIHPVEEAGIPYLTKGDVLHHKFAVIDDKTVVVGSQNWSQAANDVNDEALIVIHNNQNIARFYSQEYERLKERSFLGPTTRLIEEIEQREINCALQ
ncbi:MAG: competence protein ComE [Deltaproteobacteria bacterium]|nr:competence protein ComE [Deltaproteobacteria bacterium]